jgi:hypothetical protein
MTQDIDKLIEDYGVMAQYYDRHRTGENHDAFANAKDALLSEFQQMERRVIDLEAEHNARIAFVDKYHRLEQQLASEREAHSWRINARTVDGVILELDDDIDYVAKKFNKVWHIVRLPATPESDPK